MVLVSKWRPGTANALTYVDIPSDTDVSNVSGVLLLLASLLIFWLAFLLFIVVVCISVAEVHAVANVHDVVGNPVHACSC